MSCLAYIILLECFSRIPGSQNSVGRVSFILATPPVLHMRTTPLQPRVTL